MPQDFRKRVVFYYNTFAGAYDLTEFSRRETRNAMVKASGCKSGDRVLEICAGTCELALAFARQGIYTVAVDLAKVMLKIGSQKSEFDHLDFLEADALQLPFQTKSFNVVAVSLALHHMPEIVQIRVMREMARLAQDKVLMLEWHTPSKPILQTLKGLLIQLMDVSEYIQPWMHQDFTATCKSAGLNIIQENVITRGFHRLTISKPV
jgi:ubiquinone/menaquinone biosynthesis C-methylase UbiE